MWGHVFYGDLPRAAFFEDNAKRTKKVIVDSGCRWAEGPEKQNNAPEIKSTNKQKQSHRRAAKKGRKTPLLLCCHFLCLQRTPPQGTPFASPKIVKTGKERTVEKTEGFRRKQRPTELPRQDLFLAALLPSSKNKAPGEADGVNLPTLLLASCFLLFYLHFAPAC